MRRAKRSNRSVRVWRWSRCVETNRSLMAPGNFVVVAGLAFGRIRQGNPAEDFIEAAFLGVQLFNFPTRAGDGISHGSRELAVAYFVGGINPRPNHARLLFHDG